MLCPRPRYSRPPAEGGHGRAPLQSLLTERDVALRVEALAEEIAPRLRPGAVAVPLLLGGIWFAADLTRALHRRGVDLACDALWLSSYGDARTSRGRVEVRAGLQTDVRGRQVLVIDDVLDTGLSLQEAARILAEAGAEEVLTCVFARKAGAPEDGCDFAAWEAPDLFLVGYGMDEQGLGRGRPDIGALDGKG